MRSRVCSRTGCSAAAVATLTYVYADSTAVLGPLALQSDPNGYDLCQRHEANLSAPRGWEVIRLPAAEDADAEPSSDDLLALANAVREVGFALDPPPADATAGGRVVELARRGHLTVLADPDA
ncbi:DUF3499 domain-containing protein [Enemella evansiae]|uniref:DUF3499 domain-containing protein n=1 Tax=Enemella evansiae TaxID=2016499 RepID=A0A255FY59_9ACTN|nr:DUF3499 domain-containing protein [Enemella evansiae]OYO07124.1 hypothetical protein CGZ98_19615 [Enemella evansiae]OYO08628.1 hypothetical protein CGZ94_19065 [Enemella evansiae]OYO11446.1 hypothetical protein BI335_16620 [Enemella evansiae]TDO88087.1 uncharacterized protein DUF3499 [Enemella evansiae]